MERRLLRAVLPILLILVVAGLVRVAAGAALGDGPLRYLHHWTESDMHYFREWARGISGGDLLSERSGRPAHSWHDVLAGEAHAAGGSAVPYDASVRDRTWNRWLGEGRFYQDPLYPYLLASWFALTGAEEAGGLFILQGILGLASALLVFAVARILFDGRTALIAGLLAGLYGPLILYEGLLLRCALVTFMGLATLAVGIAAMRYPSNRLLPVVFGFLSGVAALAKSSALLFFLAFVLLLLIRFRGEGRGALVRPALCAAGLAVALLPLGARNLAVGVAPWSLAASGPITFLNHNAADYDPRAGDSISADAASILMRTGGSGPAVARETVSTHGSIWGWLSLLARKLAAFWHWYEVPNNASYDYFLMKVGRSGAFMIPFALLGPLAVAGLLLSGRRSWELAVALAYLLCGLGLVLLFYHLSRFRVPIALALAPFAAYGITGLVDRVRSRRYGVAAVAVILMALSAAFLLRPLPGGRARIRVADYGVANEISVHLAGERAAAGRAGEAIDLLQEQLETMPADLRDLEPGPEPGRLSPFSAALSGAFAPVHGKLAAIYEVEGQVRRAQRHARRAEILQWVAARYREAK